MNKETGYEGADRCMKAGGRPATGPALGQPGCVEGGHPDLHREVNLHA